MGKKNKSRLVPHASQSEIAQRIMKHIQREVKNFWALPGCWANQSWYGWWIVKHTLQHVSAHTWLAQFSPSWVCLAVKLAEGELQDCCFSHLQTSATSQS